ncbi:hypothetical protein L6R52_09700 [Myxococcota bacterium]|nr:hypothetical protein [Myxococcota bacterium]
MAADLRPLARDLCAGKLGPASAARAHLVTEVLGAVLGPGGPAGGEIPEARVRTDGRLRTIRDLRTQHTAAEAAAQALVTALLTRDLDALAPRLMDEVFVLWPDGRFARHARDVLVPALRARSGDAMKVMIERVRSYAPAELRNVLPRGVPEGIEQLFGAEGLVTVTMHLDRPVGGVVGLSIFMSLHESGTWRAHNLPVADLDAAVRLSAGVSHDADEAVRLTDHLVRHVVLGHDRHVRALRNHVMDKVLLAADRLEPAEALATLAGTGTDRRAALETVFRPSDRAGRDAIERVGGRALVMAVERRAKEAWGRPFERLKHRVVSTKLATIDPSTLLPAGEREVVAISIGVQDQRDGPERWRLGALFTPPER